MKLITTRDHRLPEEHVSHGGRGWGGRFVRLPVAGLMLLICGGVAHALNGDASKEKPKDRVVAKVNGMPIFASDLNLMARVQERMLRLQFASDPARLSKELAEVKRNALNGLIDFQLLEDEFFRLGGMISQEDIDEDVQYEMQAAFKGDRAALMAELNVLGITYDKYRELRERMIIASAVRARIANHVEVTEAMVQEHYEKNLQLWRGPDSAKFHTLTIRRTSENTRNLMESLRTRLVNGADFAEVAREFSMDSRAEDGGAWPWTSLADISPKVGLIIEKTKKGELSEVIEQPGVYIVLRVDERREAAPRPFESVKDEVKKSLLEKLAVEQIENRLCRLREAAAILKLGPV